MYIFLQLTFSILCVTKVGKTLFVRRVAVSTHRAPVICFTFYAKNNVQFSTHTLYPPTLQLIHVRQLFQAYNCYIIVYTSATVAMITNVTWYLIKGADESLL